MKRSHYWLISIIYQFVLCITLFIPTYSQDLYEKLDVGSTVKYSFDLNIFDFSSANTGYDCTIPSIALNISSFVIILLTVLLYFKLFKIPDRIMVFLNLIPELFFSFIFATVVLLPNEIQGFGYNSYSEIGDTFFMANIRFLGYIQAFCI